MERSFKSRLLALFCIVALCALACFAVAGCENGQQPPAADQNQSQPAERPEPAAVDPNATRIFTDSLGRQVEVPVNITKVAPSGHMATQVLLTFAPEKLVGISAELDPAVVKYIGGDCANLPVFGAAFGAKGDLNKEAVAASGAQILIDTGERKEGIGEDLDALQEQLGIPCVFIETYLDGYGTGYRLLGDLLGMPERGEELARYCENAYQETQTVMATIPESERANIAFLLGDSGLNGIAKGSYQGQVVDMCANNVVVVDNPSGKGTGNEISLEQISVWNPEVIVFQSGSIYGKVGGDPVWANIDAVKSGRVYEVPSEPYCWLNNPPSVNQIMGVQWLPRLLYPDKFSTSIEDVTRSYYKTFYGYDLSDAELAELLAHAK
ncbi:MAG: ABC transporter substrate-binding protein [Coriobacteriales bacterium]|nr:ABC transporter substrate-binding protein [Coriobacteriales bacterium]